MLYTMTLLSVSGIESLQRREELSYYLHANPSIYIYTCTLHTWIGIYPDKHLHAYMHANACLGNGCQTLMSVICVVTKDFHIISRRPSNRSEKSNRIKFSMYIQFKMRYFTKLILIIRRRGRTRVKVRNQNLSSDNISMYPLILRKQSNLSENQSGQSSPCTQFEI